MTEKTVCSRCDEPMIRMYRPEFIYQNKTDEKILFKPHALKDIVLCETCCNQIVSTICRDDILDKIIMFREAQGLTLEEIGTIVHKNRDELSKKYSRYLTKAVNQLSEYNINKIAALYKAGWSVKDIYYDFAQRIPIDVIAKVTTGKLWKNFKSKEKNNE